MSEQHTLGRPASSVIEPAAHEVIVAGLMNGDSAFTPGRAVWVSSNLEELRTAFVDQPDISGASFEDKLAKQLDGASDGAIQLFAEIFYLNLLPLADYKGPTKRALLRNVLAKMDDPASIPESLDAPLDSGVFNGGVAFKTRRYQQIALLIEFTRMFMGRPPEARAEILYDPWKFRDSLSSVTAYKEPAQRNALLYLAFPRHYLPIASKDHRRQIRDAFLDRIDSTSNDIDRDLYQINQTVMAEQGGPVDFYQQPWRAAWDPQGSPQADDPAAPRWEQFVEWATRFHASIDLDVEERDYKAAMAERLSSVRELMVDEADSWAEELRHALNSTNLLSSFFRIALFNDLRDHPGEIRSAILRLWGPAPDIARFDQFRDDLKAVSGQASYTAGNATSLGSVLLMARDLSQYPPYRPTPVTKAVELTGGTAAGATPSERYEALLDLCDELIERAADHGVELRDRLDAQGLIWTVVSYQPPSSWSEEDRTAFLEWRGDSAEAPVEKRRAWLVRGSSVNGRDLVPTWFAKGTVSLAASRLRDVEPGITRDELKPIVDEDYSHTSYAAKAEKLDEFEAFLSRMRVGDLVATTSQGRFFVGELSGDALYVDSDDGRSNLRRRVNWVGPTDGIDYAELPNEIVSRLQVQREVLDMTQQLELLEAYLDATPGPTPLPEPLAKKLVLKPATGELARTLHVPLEWLQECVDLLADRPQLIFYGPPGTGKTYIAQALAKHLAGDNVRLVQFHPAYSYEDFFEGYRPTPEGSFALRPGPLRKIVDQARENPATPYVLIIDEINRGNLAKVFGELYFLLEYREHNVDLLYATDDNQGFTLPDNVLVIGTMNTADRSIALVDAAMRRRFAFVALHPSEAPTNGVLRSWLEAEGYDGSIADLLDRLNQRIEDPDFKIGPSYFMRPRADDRSVLERTWRTAILPLLEEHHYGEGLDVGKTYRLDHIWGQSIELDATADGGEPAPPATAPVVPEPEDGPTDDGDADA